MSACVPPRRSAYGNFLTMKKPVKNPAVRDLATWKRLNDQRYDLVRRAREEGITWDEIERASGIRRNQASQWYARNGQAMPVGNPRFGGESRDLAGAVVTAKIEDGAIVTINHAEQQP